MKIVSLLELYYANKRRMEVQAQLQKLEATLPPVEIKKEKDGNKNQDS